MECPKILTVLSVMALLAGTGIMAPPAAAQGTEPGSGFSVPLGAALVALGNHYRAGTVDGRGGDEALSYYLRLAALDIDATIGAVIQPDHFAQGRPGHPDEETAARVYHLAATIGQPDALMRLGISTAKAKSYRAISPLPWTITGRPPRRAATQGNCAGVKCSPGDKERTGMSRRGSHWSASWPRRGMPVPWLCLANC